MKYQGIPFYEPHVRGDVAELRRRASALLRRPVPEPRLVRVSEIRSPTKRGGAWATRMAGNWGVSFADNDDIWIVTSTGGVRNRAWREDLFHEVAHVVLFAAMVPGPDHHALFRKLRVPV